MDTDKLREELEELAYNAQVCSFMSPAELAKIALVRIQNIINNTEE